MEEKDDLLEEIRKQNKYQKSQLNCMRVVMAVLLLVIMGIGAVIFLGYPKVQTVSESLSALGQKADETMTSIQSASNQTDQVMQQAEEILENLKPASEEIEKLDMENLVNNLNTLSQNIEALDLEKFQTLIQGLQEAVETAIKLAGLVR